MYWILNEDIHHGNYHSALDPPARKKYLHDEFVDTYIEHRNKKFRAATVKRTKPTKKVTEKRKRKRPKPRKQTQPAQIDFLVPPPIDLQAKRPKRMKPEPIVKVEEF